MVLALFLMRRTVLYPKVIATVIERPKKVSVRQLTIRWRLEQDAPSGLRGDVEGAESIAEPYCGLFRLRAAHIVFWRAAPHSSFLDRSLNGIFHSAEKRADINCII